LTYIRQGLFGYGQQCKATQNCLPMIDQCQ